MLVCVHDLRPRNTIENLTGESRHACFRNNETGRKKMAEPRPGGAKNISGQSRLGQNKILEAIKRV